MPQPTSISSEQSKSAYLDHDRQVNIQKNLREQAKLKEGGLQNVEIRKTAKQLGKDDFLQLLITQLTYQDPTAPVKDQQFIAQMAQFSSLEQMQNMASAVNKMADRQGQALLGKFIVGKDFVSGEQISGVAGAFFFDDGGDAFLKVGGRVVSVNDVVLVGEPSQFKQEYGGTGAPQAGGPGVAPAPAAAGTARTGADAARELNRPADPAVQQQQAAAAQEYARNARQIPRGSDAQLKAQGTRDEAGAPGETLPGKDAAKKLPNSPETE
jgi:flagellar basal-body rod modification protein FlgD